MKDNQYLIELLEKYQAGNISEEEKAMLESWYNTAAASGDAAMDNTEVQESLQHIKARLPLPRQVNYWPRMVAAAAVVLLAGGSLLYFTRRGTEHQPTPLSEKADTIRAGGNHAILQLASGQQITLNSQQKGIVLKGKQVLYNDGHEVTTANSNIQLQYMQLITPKGGQYQITLPDGTLVWLNSASKLTYPDHFEGENRKVELEGEAYFAVSKDVHPFIVKSRGQQVQVLGTEFNIMAYADESEIQTALVSGAVKVNETVLKPGFEAHYSPEGIQVVASNLKMVTAWKNGWFYFRDASLQTVMNQLQRWYDIEVIYQSERKGDEFNGQIPRDKPLNKVLEILSLSGINFKMNGRQLIVY
ncbi:FecR domain-containing protein [Chitinophaga sp.]|uniref:FecR family protein n=1 Tax=Chitinophaga sp. TaxID=1869181 RepID=UPI0031E15E7A